MEFRGNSSTSSARRYPEASRPAAPQTAPESGGNMNQMPQKSKTKQMLIIAAVVVVVLAVLGAAFWWQQRGAETSIKSNQYQAIFLTNGQVYFGKISGVNEKYIKLERIFYLQVQQSVQPAETKNTDGSQQQISLAKLGEELHGPEDQMFISRDQVLFWENLKDNGKVVDAIKKSGK